MALSWSDRIQRISPVLQNLIVGTGMGLLGAIVLKVILRTVGSSDWVWQIFILLGLVLGVLSGLERKRMLTVKEEKKRLAADLDRANLALRKSMEKYKLVVESMSDALFVTSEEGRFLLFNQATVLLSGYTEDELRNMPLSQLTGTRSVTPDASRAWLDNSLTRYETAWKTKHGNPIDLEVCSRWMKIYGSQVIVHTARDISRRKMDDQERRKAVMHRMHKCLMEETAVCNQMMYKNLLNPQYKMIGLINDLKKKHQIRDQQVEEMLTEWERNKVSLQRLLQRNTRNLENTPRNWDINEILRQELDYLQWLSGSPRFVRRLSLDDTVPPLWANGADLSLAFGTLMQAFSHAMEKGIQKELHIRTNKVKNHIYVEFEAAEAEDLTGHYAKVLYPDSDRKNGKSVEAAMELGKEFFKAFDATLEFSPKDSTASVRVAIAVKVQSRPSHSIFDQPPGPSGEDTIL